MSSEVPCLRTFMWLVSLAQMILSRTAFTWLPSCLQLRKSSNGGLVVVLACLRKTLSSGGSL